MVRLSSANNPKPLPLASSVTETAATVSSPLARKPSLPPLPQSPKPSASAPAPATKKKPRKRVRITDVDLALLEAVYRAGRITLPQLARAVESITENKRSRVNTLVREGYLGVDESHEMKRYWLRNKGLAAIGMAEEKERSLPPAASTLSHSNKLTTVLIGLSIGDTAFNTLAEREVESANRDIRARNKRWEEENMMLIRQQSELSRKAVLTDAEKRLMAKKPKSMSPLLPMEEGRRFFDAEYRPKLVIPELIMLRDERMKGETACRRDWDKDVEAFLTNPMFPTRTEDEPIALTYEDRKAMESVLEGTAAGNGAYIFKHWNMDGKFEKKHGWDGIIVLPHIIGADGTISGGSWAVEMEENKKTPAEIQRVLEQAIDHPLLEGVIYFTDKRQIATRVMEARKSLILKMANQNSNYRISMDDRKAEAERIVKAAVRIQKPQYINYRANIHGLWG